MIKFKDLYNAIKNTEQAYQRMGVDMDNAMCAMPKCVLNDAQLKLLDSYMELANVDVDFCELDFSSIIQQIDDCFHCVTDEFKGMLPEPLPEPEETVDLCTGTTVVPLEHIKRFRIYERTFTSPSIPSPIQVYIVTKESLPYTFEPFVDESVTSHERYYVAWNAQRDSLKIKVDHDQFPESMGAPTGSYNITSLVAEIEDQFVSTYGVSEIRACTAMLMTPGVGWETNHGLDKALDGDAGTYTKSLGEPSEITVEFQFKV